MMQNRIGPNPLAGENPLGLSWHDSAWIPMLNPSNIMDYFSERSNPFFDRTCNNEIVKMQRLSPEQLSNMTGLEYILLHVQEPILYVIRKQHRHSPTQVTPLADYYIIAGIVYQAPDLASVLNSRILSTVHHLQSSFEESTSFSRYHPSKGYSWDFKPNKPGLDRSLVANSNAAQANTAKEAPSVPKEEPSTMFQRHRVDMLLAELVRQFPIPVATQPPAEKTASAVVNVKVENGTAERTDTKPPENQTAGPAVTIKQEPGEPNGPSTPMTNGVSTVSNGPSSGGNAIGQQEMKPPPEKKPRIN